MKKATLISICIFTAVYAMVASSMWGTPTFIDLPFEFMQALYLPSAVAAVVCFLISLYLTVSSKTKSFYGFCAVLCIPMIAYVSYRPEYFYMKGYKGDQKLLGEFQSAPQSILMVLMTYYRLHPERFHKTGYADFVVVDGFADYIRSLPPGFTWTGANPQMFQVDYDQITTKGDVISTPWGTPIQFLLNTNGDYYVKTPDGNAGSDEVNDPWRKHGVACKAIVGIYADRFPSKYFPSDSTHVTATLNDADYDEDIQTSSKWIYDTLTAQSK